MNKYETESFHHVLVNRDLYKCDILYFCAVGEKICEVLENFSVDFLFIEDYAYGATGKMYSIGEFLGVIKLMLLKNKLDYTMTSPTYIKKIYGKGNSTKMEMFHRFCYLYEKGELNISNEYFKDVMALSHKCIKNNKMKSPLSDILDSFYICYHELYKRGVVLK